MAEHKRKKKGRRPGVRKPRRGEADASAGAETAVGAEAGVAADRAAYGFAYVALFGVGSIIGMAALSAMIAVPLSWSAGALTWANRGLQGAVGVATVAIGVTILYQTPVPG